MDNVLSLEHSEHFENYFDFNEMYEITEKTRTRNYVNQDGTILNLADLSTNNVFDFRK